MVPVSSSSSFVMRTQARRSGSESFIQAISTAAICGCSCGCCWEIEEEGIIPLEGNPAFAFGFSMLRWSLMGR